MLEHFWHWLACIRGNPGHIAFGEARRLYLAYLGTVRKGFDQIGDGDFAAARSAPDLARAEELYLEARANATAEGRSDNVAIADYQLGMLFHLQGRLSEARRHLRHCLSAIQANVAAGPSERSTLSGCWYHLGIIAMREGRASEARRLLHQSLEIDQADADIGGIAMCNAALQTVATWPFDSVATGEGPAAPTDEAEEGSATAATEPDDRRGERPKPWGSEVGSPAPGATAESQPVASGASESLREAAPLSTDPAEYYQALSSGTDVIWLVSHSVEANDVYMAELERQLGRGVARKLRIERAAFGSADHSQHVLSQIAADERLCAAILILEEEGLCNPKFLEWGWLCMDRVADTDDFRLFVGVAAAAGSDLGAYEQTAGPEGHPLIHDLVDTVQFAATGEGIDSESSTAPAAALVPGPREVCEACRSYLRDVDSIRSAAIWRTLRLSLAEIGGRAAFAAQAGAASLLALMALALLVLGRDTALPRWIHSHADFGGLLAGVVLFPLNTFPLFFILRGLRAIVALPQRRPDLARTFTVLVAVSLGLSYLMSSLEAPAAWVLLGLGAGAILDHARRVGLDARRAGISLPKCREWSGQVGLPDDLLVQGSRTAEHPWIAPLFPATRPRVFISYAHRTRWSQNMAHRLHRLLQEQGTVSFLDREAIGAGSSWRAALNRCIGHSDVFISIIEPQTLLRQWVAAELIAALAGRAKSGAPRIVVLADPDMDARSASRGFPVFQAVLGSCSAVPDDRQPRMVKATEASLTAVASGLRPAHYETSSVVPGDWSLALQYLTLPIVSVGPLGELLGLPAAVLFYLEYWNKTSVGTYLADWHLLGTACLAAGYLAGFCARLVASTAFEVRHQRGRGPTVAHAISCGGLLAIAILWSQRVDPLVAGWTIVLGGVGYCLAGLFLQNVKRAKPELFGPD